MTKHILIINGHPDPDPQRFIHALAEAYARGAGASGYEVQRIAIGNLDFPLIATREQWETDAPPAAIRDAQEMIAWSNHLVILYPLWLGDVPARLKAFLEQVMRPGFAFTPREGKLPAKGLKGRSAQIIVTMGMPALFYRLYFGAHSVKSLERNILRFTGIAPVRHTLIGNVEGSAEERAGWLEETFALGEAGA